MTSLTKSQSQLRAASDAYCDQVAAEGWIEEANGFATLAGTLMNGKPDADSAAGYYARQIGADSKAPALVLGLIAVDSQAARRGLDVVTSEARTVLNSASATASNRGDVMSFERALIRAQMAHRGFQEALDLVSVRADMETAPIASEIEGFAEAIDEARRIADQLTDRYTGENPAAS